MSANVLVKVLPHFEGMDEDSPLHYATPGAAAVDLYSSIYVTIAPGERKAVPTGVKIQMPQDMEMQIRPRSGLALKEGLTVLNTPGTVDADYRGEIVVVLYNSNHPPQRTLFNRVMASLTGRWTNRYTRRLKSRDISISWGDRIAQAKFSPVLRPTFRCVDDLTATARGEGGFGSTGR